MKPKTMYVAVKGLFFKHSRLLLLKKRHEGFWDIPGGRIEFGESIEEALRRELSEELLNVKSFKIGELIGVRKKPVPLEDGNELFLVYYKIESNLPADIELSNEHCESKWFEEQEIESLPDPLDKVYGELFSKLMTK